MPIRNLLLTNDDGLGAIGLHVLATVLSSHYDVYVVAPDRERSGVGHGFTLLNPLRADPMPDAFGDEQLAKAAYRCSGTPVDCVKLGLLGLFKDVKFDLVISGINRGANLAVDTLYSGTVGGAMEALIMGYPAIAVSLVSKGRTTSTRQHFETAAQVVLELVREHEAQIARSKDFLLNVNVPGLPREELKGIKFTVLGRCHYADRYHVHKDPMGRPYYWLEGDLVIEDERPNADIVAIRDNFVSVTPLHYDLTSEPGRDAMAEWEPQRKPAKKAAKRRAKR
jgi:5'-nucleotidase